MLSVKTVLCVVLAAVCAASTVLAENEVESVVLYESTDIDSFEVIESLNITNGNGFNIGHLHPGSVVAQSSYLFVNGIVNNFASGRYTYNGTRPITYITAIDQNINGTGGYVYRVEGGVFQNTTIVHFQSSIRGGAINFLVTVYVEGAGNNLVLGALTTNSVLLYERSVVVSGLPNQIFTSTVNVVFDNLRPISFIEVLDRTTNATGGTATITSGGLNQTQITVSLQSSAAGRGINSHIIIHGAARNSTNDFRFGRFNPGNINLNTQRLFIPAIANQRVSGNVFYNGNRTITLLQGLALNGNASAGELIAVGGGINTNSATLVFESIIGGFIDFTVSFYG